MNLLTLEDVDVFYGDLQATFGVTLHVDEGETIAIIGANGAGKSTLLRAIIGLTPTRRGNIILAGEDITRQRCDLIARRGVALVPEGRRLFSSLTVEENLLMGMARARPGPWTLQSVYALFPAMRELRRQLASDISGGQQQMVAIGRALLTNPRLMLCDELSLGLAPKVINDIIFLLRRHSRQRHIDRDRRAGHRTRAQFLAPALLPAERAGHAGRERPGRDAGGDQARLFWRSRFMSFVEAFINGLMVGGLYGLFGLGLALAFGIMRVVNIAHGEFIVLAAYLGVSLLTLTPLPLVAVVVCVAIAAFALGWLLQAALLNRVLGPNPVPGMVVTIGLSIVLRNLLVKIYGSNIRSIEVGPLQDAGVDIFGVSIGVLPLLIFAAAVVLFVATNFLLTRTTIGRAFRAAADDFEILETLGFNRRRVYSAAMGLAVTLSALAGLLLAMRSSFSPFSGAERLLIAFEVVIIGGLGSLRGCFLGGLFLGVVQVVGLRINPNSGPLFGHLAFFVVLLARQMDLSVRLAWRRG